MDKGIKPGRWIGAAGLAALAVGTLALAINVARDWPRQTPVASQAELQPNKPPAPEPMETPRPRRVMTVTVTPQATEMSPQPDAANVAKAPAVVELSCRMVAPEYAHRPVYEGALPATGIAALAGTQVEIRARGNVPLGAGTLTFIGDDRAASSLDVPPAGVQIEPMALDDRDDHVAVGSITLNDSGRIAVQVADSQGRLLAGGVALPVTILLNQPPTIRILSPASDLYVRPDDVVTMDVLAEDDCGILHMELQRSLNDLTATSVDYPVDGQPRRVSMRARVDLSQWDLAPGDTIKLRVAVSNNDPAGGKTAYSPVVTIHVLAGRGGAVAVVRAVMLEAGSR